MYHIGPLIITWLVVTLTSLVLTLIYLRFKWRSHDHPWRIIFRSEAYIYQFLPIWFNWWLALALARTIVYVFHRLIVW